MNKIAIVGGVRTPLAKAWTVFDRLSAQKLGALCLVELLQRTGIEPGLVDEVIVGCVGQPIEASNVARVISLQAGLPKSKRAYTVSRNCASGLEAVASAAEKIWAGQDAVVIAGGAESMSNAPLVFSKESAGLFMKLSRAKTLPERLAALSAFRPRHFAPKAALELGLTDVSCGLNMGQTAEVLAKKFGISRQRQDAFALESHRRVIATREKLREEMMSVPVPPKFETIVKDDNGVREGLTAEQLAKLRPVFDRRSGSVTAGNSSQITDGACLMLVMEEERARALGLPVLGTIRAYDTVGVEPSEMGLGPAYVIEKILKTTGHSAKDIGLYEINEAFAVQVLACLELMASKGIDIDPERLNVNGGAIALGHPVGVSGARLILTCLLEMKRRGVERGLVSMCIGGGQGSAMILEAAR